MLTLQQICSSEECFITTYYPQLRRRHESLPPSKQWLPVDQLRLAQTCCCEIPPPWCSLVNVQEALLLQSTMDNRSGKGRSIKNAEWKSKDWNMEGGKWNFEQIPTKIFHMIVEAVPLKCHSQWKCTNLKMSNTSPLKFFEAHPALLDRQDFLELRGQVISAP